MGGSLAERFAARKRAREAGRDGASRGKEAEGALAGSTPAGKAGASSQEAAQQAADGAKPANGEEKGAPRLVAKEQAAAKEATAAVKDAKAAAKGARSAARRVRKGVRKARRRRRSASESRRVLGQLLRKAGYDTDPVLLKRRVFFLTLFLICVATAFTLLSAAVSAKPALDLLVFYGGLWTAIFAFCYLFLWMVIYVYLDVRIYRRTRELEEVLPDFLQLASANISAGMPMDRALWFAVRPNFGVLAKEIEDVAKATLAGEELSESLVAFSERYDSLMLRRSISILLEGLAAGGEMAELLNKIALNIQETKLQQQEMSANVATYAIFITFASIVMAPLLFALATELLGIIVGITSSLDLSSATGSFLALNPQTSPGMIDDFQWFSVAMLSISALMSGAIVSVIRRGRVREGIRNLPIFLAVSLTLYFLARAALGVMLGGIV